DILMASPVIVGLRKKYPNAEIDLLVNSPYHNLSSKFFGVNRIIPFERRILQDGLVKPERAQFESFDKMKTFIQMLNMSNYSLVVNLTQNKLSGYLTEAIEATEKLGLTLNEMNQPRYGNIWFKYLNDVVGAKVKSIFHFTDINYFGLGLGKAGQQFHFNETDDGRDEVDLFLKMNNVCGRVKIVIQPLTSDEKKNFPIRKWQETIEQIRIFDSKVEIILLGAPNEAAVINQMQIELKEKNITVHVAILSIAGAFSLLKKCNQLLTGDTSIKHLAAATDIAVFELSLGSSDLRKTGAYSKNSLILKSKVGCSPCQHNSNCLKSSHECSALLRGDLLGLAAIKHLHGDWAGLKILADEYEDEFEFYKTDITKLGFWHADNILNQKSESSLSDFLDLAAWKFLIEKQHLLALAPYGFEGCLIREYIKSNWAASDETLLRLSLGQIENSVLDSEYQLNKILSSITKSLRSANTRPVLDFIENEFHSDICNLESKLKLGNYFSEKLSLDDNLGLFKMRRLQSSLSEVFNHQQIKLKLVCSIKNQILNMNKLEEL
ncbi:MAG: glycosyltransferase family 9 protein, partial [Bdellovibrionales bacterium]